MHGSTTTREYIRQFVRLARVDKSALRVDTSRQYWTFEIRPGHAVSCVHILNGSDSEKIRTLAPQMCASWWYFGNKLEQMTSPIFYKGPGWVSKFMVQILRHRKSNGHFGVCQPSLFFIHKANYHPGGRFSPTVYLLYGDVPLDRVWFSGIPGSNRVYNSCVCVLNRVFIYCRCVPKHWSTCWSMAWCSKHSTDIWVLALNRVPNQNEYSWTGYHIFLITLLNRVWVSQCQRHIPTQ